jgi:hypothetical protein
MLDGLTKYSFPFDEDRSSQRVVMAPSQISVSALWVSTPFKTELRSLIEHLRWPARGFLIRVVVVAAQSGSPFQPSRAMRNVHKGAPITVIPLGGRQLPDR